LPEDFAQSLAQTPDGYLWIGTSGGLARFDGTTFVVFNRENTPAFLDDSVYSLLVTRDGTLWAGLEGGGLIRYKEGRFRGFGSADGLTNGFVRVIYEDKSLQLWVGTDSGLFSMRGDSLVRVDGRDGIPTLNVHSILEDRAGHLLVGGWGLLVLRGKEVAYYTSTESLADNSIRTIRQTADGALWIGTISGLRRLEHGVEGDPFAVRKIMSSVNISVLLESHRGGLWIGTYGAGAMRYEDGRILKFSAPSSMPHNSVLALLEDSEGDIWVGSQGGLLRLSQSAASTITTADGAPQSINTIYHDPRGDLMVTALNGKLFRVVNQALAPVRLPSPLNQLSVRNVFRDSRGALWLGTDGQGIARISDTGIARYTMKEGLVNDFIRAFCEDRDGAVWIGTDGGLSRFHQERFQNFKIAEGLAYDSIRALLLDRRGDLWVATDGGLSRFRDGQIARDEVLEGLRGRKLWSLHEDSEGKLWIGTHGDGLFMVNKGSLVQFTTRMGLPSNKIHFIGEDSEGSFWMSGPSGIVVVSRRELEDSSKRSVNGQLAVRVYSTAEGLSTNQMNGGVQPAGALLTSGEMWFPSTIGAVRIEPGGPKGRGAPPVIIEKVLADDRAVSFSRTLSLVPGRGKLEIHYTAIRLQSPDRIRFKFRMEDFDQDWTDAGERRVAYYTNLPAGSYRFHVVAHEIDNPRNAAEQVLGIEWRPHFYETSWFLALCGLAVLGLAFGGYGMHVRNLRQRFNAVLQERTRLAREMHDTLIQGCVGVSALLEASSSARGVSSGISDELLDRARSEVRATVDEARMAVWNLRQGSSEGLAPALSQLTQRLSLETGIPITFESSGTPVDLGAENERSLLMIAREALQNALRHAAPKHVSVHLNFDAQALQMEIEDDGCGFDAAIIHSSNGRHYGLIGMRERAEKLGGRLALTTSPGKGTHVCLNVPLAGWLPTSKGSGASRNARPETTL